jgi:hypothetical protein
LLDGFATELQLKMRFGLALIFVTLLAACCAAQESPYFVTYNHHMEEPGNLEIETQSTSDVPRTSQKYYFAPWTEFEYGMTANWTTEFYLDGQITANDSAIFTGWRFENRYRPFRREHLINPVLYVEYENINGADRIQKEIEGRAPDVSSPNGILRREIDRELETKLILSSDIHDWNLAGNFIAAKNFTQSEGIEFGYAVAFSRPLATLASGENCRFCRENFSAGMELYGGLGSTLGFGFRDTAHYAAPVIAWAVSDNATLRFSPGIGLTHESSPVLFRFGYSYEIRGFGSRLSRLFRSKP